MADSEGAQNRNEQEDGATQTSSPRRESNRDGNRGNGGGRADDEPTRAESAPRRRNKADRPPPRRPKWLDVSPAQIAQRIIGIAGLVVILWAVAYALLPYSITTPASMTPNAPLVTQSCDPAVVQVFNRGPKVPGLGGQPVNLKPPCTAQAEHRLYVAVPTIILVLIAVTGLRRVLL